MNRPPSKIELLEKEKGAQQEVWARACKHRPETKKNGMQTKPDNKTKEE